MNTITSFTFHENHNVRIIKLDNDDFLFHANDLCAVLKYVNPRDAIRRHVDVEDVVKHDTLTNGGKQKQNYVKEAGMWALVLGSETEQAKLVKRWVTSEVLPALRKTGRYETTKATDTRDYLTNNDMNNIKRLIWACSSNVSHGKAFENGIWHALRQVTGVPSPSKFEVKHLPVLADEFQRILNILEPYFEARRICEESLIKRVLRERADHIIINELLDQMITVTNTAKTSIKKQIDKTITSQACINLKNRNVCDHKYA
ncbi:BRO family protein [Acinetobacter johnsonii]|uniref:BRO family protein n=1 Tax=Acinetobacter johnsonii TaxID=40214 RepID=A0AA42MA40_ACIJO|nr:BRO family protein [Acinetobacter johnsonii]MDH0826606.1 BRO family protein [Acinetobacter johnsonii]